MPYSKAPRIDILIGLTFEHIHLISADPLSAIQWYVDKLAVDRIGQVKLRGTSQININVGRVTLLICGSRSAELPKSSVPM